MIATGGLADIRIHFENLTDPRRGEPTYPLLNVVVMTLCAVISGADDFVAISRWSTKNRTWLARYLDLSAGVPSHDRFNAIFAAMNAREFEMCLLSWITSLHEITSGQVIAIDGKTLRRSYDAASSKSAIHMVSAWATMNHISLGQVVVDARSNEITAIPKLLDLIDVSGGMVTIDAMGCQTEIIEKIVEKKADACIAVKKNQPKLYAAIQQHFDALVESDFLDAKIRWMSSSGCDLRIARCREIEKVVYVKRGVPPDNVCSHTNTTGKDASYGRSGYSKDAGLCNSQGHRFLLADDADGGTVPDVDRSRSRVPEAGHGP